MNRPYNVLFLCTGNSARSILAEALLNRLGGGRFDAYSAGSQPKGAVHPLALELLQAQGFPTADLRSKSWDEFEAADAPKMDFVFTVCDSAAAESCPVWPGQPMTAHWGLPDPAAVEGALDARRKAFKETFVALQARLRLFTNLGIDKLDRLALKREIQQIGRMVGESV
ncbi:MAG: arsenate reductase ArsC [Alphaproteobacteria bacterium]|nr:arsenate reductase ArsC [Alphaproteobacteria bacterium]